MVGCNITFHLTKKTKENISVLYKYLFLSIVLLIVSCAAPYNRNFPMIGKGMTLPTVNQLIGKPISAESAPDDSKILHYRLASSPLDTDGSDTREYYVLLKNSVVIGYGERKDAITTMREIWQFNAAWNAVKAINETNRNIKNK